MFSARRLAAGLLRLGIGRLLRLRNHWAGILVLAYHRVVSEEDAVYDPGVVSATAEDFAYQVRWLRRHADVIGPGDLDLAYSQRPGRKVLITFDDGYLDNYQVAYPILRIHDVCALFFVCPGFVGTHRVAWWDEIAWMVRTSSRCTVFLPGWLSAPVSIEGANWLPGLRRLLNAFKQLPSSATAEFLDVLGNELGTGRHGEDAGRSVWMNWEMIREMAVNGMRFGGHTVSHPVLGRASASEQLEEIGGCKQMIEKHLGARMRYFSYPVGGHDAFNEVTRSCLKALGVAYAFNYGGGIQRFDDWDRYNIPRVPVETSYSRAVFEAICTVPKVFA